MLLKKESLKSQEHKHVGIASPHRMILSDSVEPVGETRESLVRTLDGRVAFLQL